MPTSHIYDVSQLGCGRAGDVDGAFRRETPNWKIELREALSQPFPPRTIILSHAQAQELLM